MTEPEEQSEASLTAAAVDTRGWGATEPDEEAVLASLYGPADGDGIYRGLAATPGEALPELDPSAYLADAVPLEEL